MRRYRRVFVILIASGVCSGCATFRAADNIRLGSPKIYAGTRLDVAALFEDEKTLANFQRYGINALTHPGIDLPFSLLADTFLLPSFAACHLVEPMIVCHP